MRRYPGNTMMISITPDRYGNWLVKVVSQDHNDKIVSYLKQFDVKWDGEVYLQGDECEEFAEIHNIYRQKKKDLDAGWPIRVAVDKWNFLQSSVGYDAGDKNILG